MKLYCKYQVIIKTYYEIINIFLFLIRNFNLLWLEKFVRIFQAICSTYRLHQKQRGFLRIELYNEWSYLASSLGPCFIIDLGNYKVRITSKEQGDTK